MTTDKGQEWCNREFTGGLVVRSLPANAGNAGAIPGLGGSQMLQSNEAHAPQVLSPVATTTEVSSPKACAPKTNEKPAHHNED